MLFLKSSTEYLRGVNVSAQTKKKVLEGAAITALVYGASQAIRLLSNLIMTRLLAPEHFGLMAIINVFLIGLNMFSDIGIGPNIIQSGKGQNRQFLDTIWTLQVLRGLAIGSICVVAGWPLSLFYSSAELVWIIPVAGISAVVAGFNSTNIFTEYKKLEYRNTAKLEIGTQVLTLAGMLLFAFFSPTIWALVFGAILNALLKMSTSHLMLPGGRNRFCWDQHVLSESIKFGKWIFLSTLISFASNSAGTLVLARFVSMKEVGLYAIAATLAKSVEQLYEQIAGKVLFPLYAKMRNANEPEELVLQKIKRIKIAINLSILPMLFVGVVFSEEVIRFLLDPRYEGSAWIFRAYCLGIVPVVISGIGPFYLAHGNSRLVMTLSGTRLIIYILAMFAGWSLTGEKGLIYGLALFTYFYYFAEAIAQRAYKIWLPKLDLMAFIAFFACSWLAIALKTRLLSGGAY